MSKYYKDCQDCLGASFGDCDDCVTKVSEEDYEWCYDCKEYDKEKHCCPRWNKVIRQTVAEIREQSSKVGEWIADRKNQGGFTPGGNSVKSCSLCGWIYGAHRIVPDYNYCPNCGAKMKG